MARLSQMIRGHEWSSRLRAIALVLEKIAILTITVLLVYALIMIDTRAAASGATPVVSPGKAYLVEDIRTG